MNMTPDPCHDIIIKAVLCDLMNYAGQLINTINIDYDISTTVHIQEKTCIFNDNIKLM